MRLSAFGYAEFNNSIEFQRPNELALDERAQYM